MPSALYNYARQIRGDARAVRVRADPAGEIKSGDFLMQVAGLAVRVSAQADLGLLADNQAAAHAAFLGVAIDAKAAGVAADVRAASGGVFRYPCLALAAAHDVGAWAGPEGSGAGLAVGLEDQLMTIVAGPSLAFGRLARGAAVGDVFLEVEIAGVLTTTFSGPQAAA